jgi:hypothetical protein
MDIFKKGSPPIVLNRPCMVGDGIVKISEKDMPELIATYEEAMQAGRVLKFVPASGAATRMFTAWYKLLETGISEKEGSKFASDLRKYAFFDDLKQVMYEERDSLEILIEEKKYKAIIERILTEKGLNYGALPKALLKFHKYPDETRTALEEHLVEGVLYAQDAEHTCRIHLTVSKEHIGIINNYLSKILGEYEARYGVKIVVALSTQETSTNTVTMDVDQRLFRDDTGRLLFRPGGHGALLKNLNELDGDLIFLKNVDNVVPDRLKPIVIDYKKVIGGYLVKIQEAVFHFLRSVASRTVDEKTINEISSFCSANLYIYKPPEFHKLTLQDKCSFFFENLNRPIRVCGMVRNEGEPGGGPFWAERRIKDGELSLQIVEESQIDRDSDEQRAIWKGATHFNPVDIVCGVRDYQGRKFDLKKFVDESTYFISNKFEKNRAVRTLEYPGLWNGSMARWNTIFVEVAIDTFNPVKTVDDLLRPNHLNKI